MGKFQIFYQGNYTEREKPYLAQYVAKIEELKARGPVDVKALITGTLPEGTPGVGPKLEVKEDMMLYNALKYDPENKLYTDDDYAKSAGYEGKIAMPCFGAHDDSFLTAFPGASRDIMCVSTLNHSINQLAPVYVGDILYLVKDSISLKDITPLEGCEYRSLVIKCEGTVYNQKGEVVSTVSFGATENLKSWATPEDKDPSVPGWDSPNWWSRPEYYYTDADWNKLFDIWSKETAREAEPLYWEDVNIGDMPTWTLEGPIEQTANPTAPYGMGVGGSRTMKKELMNPEIRKTMTRDEKTGIFYPADESVLKPEVPDFDDPRKNMPPPPMPAGGNAPKPEPKRGIFINFAGRDFAIRHINNWMGAYGWIKNIRWGIMTDITDFGYNIPMNKDAENFLTKLPAMSGKKINAHGLQHDVMLIKSQVYDKYVKDGEHIVELGWWIETIDGYIYEAGAATIKLPTKN